jgi:RNase H-fold protein (predicted Holliday junction resolvase)
MSVFGNTSKEFLGPSSKSLKDFLTLSPKGVLLALDWGKAFLGLALSDPTRTLARPLMCLKRSKWGNDSLKIQEIIHTYEVSGLVIGWPGNPETFQGSILKKQKNPLDSLGPSHDQSIFLKNQSSGVYLGGNIFKHSTKKNEPEGGFVQTRTFTQPLNRRCQAVADFASNLQKLVPLPLAYWDEVLTTWEAQDLGCKDSSKRSAQDRVDFSKSYGKARHRPVQGKGSGIAFRRFYKDSDGGDNFEYAKHIASKQRKDDRAAAVLLQGFLDYLPTFKDRWYSG